MAPILDCRNVIFDLDGTLVDSKPGIVSGLRYTLRQLGHELPADEVLDWAIGPPLEEVMARLLAPFGDSRSDQAVAIYRAWYGAGGLYDAQPYPGIAELLDRLTATGRTLFVGTSKRTDFARRVVEHFDLARRFRGVYGSEPHGRFQHKADLFAYLLTAEQLLPNATVVVGDRAHDVLAARAHGLRVVGVTYGYGSREELSGADLLCDSPAAVAALF